MKVRTPVKRARIELIPLLDMIFLLLVTFVYTFLSMSYQKGIPVRLPHAASSVKDERDYVAVSITSDNRIFVNKDEKDLSGMRSALSGIKNRDPGAKVTLNADKGVLYERVIKVLDNIRDIGIEKVSLETTLNDE